MRKKKQVTTIYLPKNKSQKCWQLRYPVLVLGSRPDRTAIKYSGKVEIKAVPLSFHEYIPVLGPENGTKSEGGE